MIMSRLLRGIPLTFLAGVLLVPGTVIAAANPPAPPSKMVSPLPPDAGGGRTIPVRAGDNLQAKIDDAKPGDTLVLDGGATWTGNFVLPPKSGTGWITIRGSQESQLPKAGQRISPSAAPSMPKILTPNGTGAINASDGTQGWRLVGLEVSVAPTWQSTVYQLLAFGSGSADWGKRRPTDVVTSRIIIERCYIHGSPTQKVRRGILANARDMRISDSWIDEIHDSGFDSQAILGYDGTGPLLIENNELQASSENIMFGGSDSSRPDLVPADIVIRRNHIMKPFRWFPSHPTYDGSHWVIKPLIELKSAQRVLIEGNTLENSWSWPAFVADAFNQDGTAPWSVVEDVMIRYNVVKEVTGVFQAWAGSAPVRRVAILHNNATGVRTGYPGNAYVKGKQLRLTGGAPIEDVWVEHNTTQPADSGPFTLDLSKGTFRRFTYRYNIVGFGNGGPTVEGVWSGDDASLDSVAPERDFALNALVSLGNAVGTSRVANSPSVWRQPQWLSFGDAASAGLNPDGTLSTNSPLKRRAKDGSDLGVDFERLNAALSGSGAAAAASAQPAPSAPVTAAPPPASAVGPKTK